jgi:hypothetical protein
VSVIVVELERGTAMELTANHRVFSATRNGWVAAGDLREGEALQAREGNVRVRSVHASARGLTSVFNLEVYARHEFFVGEERVRVHNGYGGKADDVVDLYRFVSPGELEGITRTGRFSFAEGMMEAKQFGLNYDEILRLSDSFSDAVAIVRARVPRSVVEQLDRTSVDPFILRSGSVTARGQGELDLLNNSLIGAIEQVL